MFGLSEEIQTYYHEKFVNGNWLDEIDVRDFIQKNYAPYLGDSSFLSRPTKKTLNLWKEICKIREEERKKGIIDAETSIPSSINAYPPAYINKRLEAIVGLQTDKLLKRAIMLNGGWLFAKRSLESFHYKMNSKTETIFKKYRKTHHDAVSDIYSDEMRKAKKSGILAELPDSYGRGRIIGDYRRLALYGTRRLIEEKKKQRDSLKFDMSTNVSASIRLKEELSEQIKALNELKLMASGYGFDVSTPASNAQEAVQWVYFAYLAAVKEQNGSAMPLGRISSFLDIYIERDIRRNILTETEAQELIDHLIMKLRIIRFLRPPEYNALFSGDPIWITECIGGMGIDGRTLVSKTSFRILQTLYNLGPDLEPNITVLWSKRLPENFKLFCAQVSLETSSIQYENDDLMRVEFGDDYGIASSVSAMRLGKETQFFGARINIAKALLYAINGGKDEISYEQIAPQIAPITNDYIHYEELEPKFHFIMNWLAKLYVNTLNSIHYMHDKYNYERLQMAFLDCNVQRILSCGVAGLSSAIDSLSAIKYAKVKVIRNKEGLAVDYIVEGSYPAFGDNDEKSNRIAYNLVKQFMNKLRQQKRYRNAKIRQSILTIASHVVYGKTTGSAPDGRKSGEPLAPGGNPMHKCEGKSAKASMSSITKIPYNHAMDGISYTFSIVPKVFGVGSDKYKNISNLLEEFFEECGQDISINVFDLSVLTHAMKYPKKYPQLIIRASGRALNFTRLIKEEQMDIINRSFYQKL